MVLTCPHCGGSVGEESCSGCRRNIRYYVCSKCGGVVPNTKYASGVTCLNCGAEVFEHPHKGSRMYQEWYVCQECGEFVKNSKFQHHHSCENCKPPKCNVCGELTALHIGKQVEVCMSCGAEFPHPL